MVAVPVAVSMVALIRTSDARFEQLQPRAAMSAAARYAASHPGADILADDTSSSAMLWKYPALYGRIGFDARLEQFDDRELKRWFRYMTVTGRNWPAATAGYEVLVVSRRDHPELASALIGLAGWRVIEDDPQGLALVRSGS
jgi:hypothetical protein